MISICVSVIRGVAIRSKKSINESIVFMCQYGFGYAPQNARVFTGRVASYQLTQFPKHLWNVSLHIFKLRIGLIDL
jgi:hypothetical protein